VSFFTPKTDSINFVILKESLLLISFGAEGKDKDMVTKQAYIIPTKDGMHRDNMDTHLLY
jgi:hypothetical protein